MTRNISHQIVISRCGTKSLCSLCCDVVLKQVNIYILHCLIVPLTLSAILDMPVKFWH